jgi:hypothetical protein
MLVNSVLSYNGKQHVRTADIFDLSPTRTMLRYPAVLTALLLLTVFHASTSQATSCVQVVDFVADCGAVAGGTENSAHWTTCVSLAKSSGLPIYVPPGKYYFNNTITSAGVKVQGAGQSVSIFYWSKDATTQHTPAWSISSLVSGYRLAPLSAPLMFGY